MVKDELKHRLKYKSVYYDNLHNRIPVCKIPPILREKLIFGNREQLNALEALEEEYERIFASESLP